MGNRKDGTLLRRVDSMHFIMPIIYPDRCDNEAYFREVIDLTALDAFLEQKNSTQPDYRYNMFQCIVCAVLKTVTLRTKMNRFIANRNIYQRNEVSAAFTVKKEFADEGGEVLAFLHAKPEFTLTDIHDEMGRQLTKLRGKEGSDKSTDAMDMFNRMPRFLAKAIVRFVTWLDKHGWVPQSLIETDPYYSSVVLANLGSIGLNSTYHHLTNWGTTSLFVTIGVARQMPFRREDGTTEMRHGVDLSFILDERLADGFYYARTLRLFKLLMENPKLLDQPLSEKLSEELWEQIR